MSNVVEQIIIVDASGSMDSRKDTVIDGFNEQLTAMRLEQVQQNVEYLVTLVTFNSTPTVVCSKLPIGNVKLLSGETYVPDGWTALYDAVGETISVAEPGQRNVNVTIYTDGGENRSRTWTSAMIKELTRIRTEENKWGFTYFGSNQDAWAQASSLGIRNFVNYTDNNLKGAIRTSGQTRSVYNSMVGSNNFANLQSMTAEVDRASLVK